jgi:hypothetical protein
MPLLVAVSFCELQEFSASRHKLKNENCSIYDMELFNNGD